MSNDNRPRRLSRRQRRVVVTAVLLMAGFTIGAVVLVRAYRQNQTAQYRPGEANADITASLARDLPPDVARPVFADVTAEAGLGDFITFAGARTSQLPEDMGPGVAWGDYDNDGDDDVFLVSAGGPIGAPAEKLAPSALFENLGNGRFQRVADFPEPRIIGMAAAWGDYDGDGWIDLAVSGYNALLLFRNDRGRFTLDAKFANRPGFWSGLAWGDYDNDRRLDLYVCGYVQYVEAGSTRAAATQQYGRSVPFTLNPASYEPQANLLFHNTGRGTLVETAARLGVANPEGRSLSALWHDFDDDGWIDLYVANDISDNVLYRNVNGRFTDISHPAWVADYRGAMGLASGDWNRDGDDDLFVTHWVAQENALYDSHAKQSGALRFADAADTVGLGQVALPMVGWGTEFLDFDSDGWLDLVVANGSTFETETAPKALVPQRPFLFWNRRGEHFYDVAPLAAPLSTAHVARGLGVSDFDGDGDLDVLIARNGGGVQLLRNDTSAGQWIQVVLRSRASADGPVVVARGAAAVAQAGAAAIRRSVTSASYLSQSTSTLHFGLGIATQVDKLTVRWRAGAVTEYGPLAAGRRWEITEGDPTPKESTRAATAAATGVAAPASERDRIVAFWDRHRAAMHALKSENNPAKAAGLFEQALAIDPTHEDARFYLATALAAQGNTDGALQQYDRMNRTNARSHRSLTGWARLRALTSRGPADLAAAEEALNRAHDLNPEETGALVMLGEIALMRGQRTVAERRLKAVVQANARAAGALFLLGYVRWKANDAEHAREYLELARTALGPEWKPAGSTAEGDVAVTVSHAATLLSRFWDQWDGAARPSPSYTSLDAYLRRTARSGTQ